MSNTTLQDIDVELILIGLASLCRVEAEKIKDADPQADVKRQALKEVSGRMLYRAHELAPGTYIGDEREDPNDHTEH